MADERPWQGNRRRLRGGSLDEEGGTRRSVRELDLNLATTDVLERVGRLGAETARDLVAFRAAHGRFVGWEDVARVVEPALVRRLRGAGFWIGHRR